MAETPGCARTRRLDKIKRPRGLYWFELEEVAEDSHGTWLRAAPGSSWGAPHDVGHLPVTAVVLLSPDRPWVPWWVDDPTDRRLEIDVCLPPSRTAQGWRYMDLELDPVRHEADRRVEIENWDEYEEAVRGSWMSPADAALAESTAYACARMLSRPSEPWQVQGWEVLGS